VVYISAGKKMLSLQATIVA